MNQKANKLLIAVFLFTLLGCVVAPPSEAVFVTSYKQRIVRVDPVTQGRTITIRVQHRGPLNRAERNDLIRWYRSKHQRPNHRIKVVFIRH